MNFILMACSATKRPESGPLTALERYDGPMWQTLRALLDRHPTAAQALVSKDLVIWVLSGRYGFVPHDIEMPNYDKRMSPEILAKMARDCSYDFQRIPAFVDDATEVLFAGGEMYRDAMWKASGNNLLHLMKITETDGPGIGVHRAQMGAWFAKHYGAAESAAA